ncbi:sugar O-acetyltransferase [Candidatus Enterococcus ferrettii]|uniref:Acetyltransferase n=1 Tax=Candidatus Enterococcus ferrettii TaxID=2815324 RepID=A0ABV0EWK2_9ENTE|nr:sugar O-acetyltransferase [Enterococcus sp. 665A]MBO1339536.1 sugar O-acetyltransferase [Enterococcus sp. 665A]
MDSTQEIKRKMDAGEIYYENSEIFEEKLHYNRLLHEFNQISPDQVEKKSEQLEKLLGAKGEGVYIEQPLHANWGKNTYLGKNVYANFNLTLVDDTRIEIHEDTMIGPNVTIITGTHPLDPQLRKQYAQYNLPVVIERNVWIGAGSIIFPGVTIGENAVIGAGSLVTKDIPPNVVAFGSPCEVTKKI